ncbi:hypothetical protein Ga0074812_10157 [Parafrankia irregularis]|uniref:PAS domain-containing protein n=1 Tax=Parafrankia irregularis TaxID=795642 RepID=A0A0S4QDS3_9ACTN|nr:MULTISPECIES: PAS domain-containing protein [Parafrankia]MBE3199768.1 hypothetical protein [Parafrankia sp. CH37]CUU53559.1 hypothetical protein Ga0074812_10157 [Parafrankia irregularis]
MPIDASQYTGVPATDYLLELVDLFDNSNIGIGVTGAGGAIRRANPAFRRLAGWPAVGQVEPSARALLGEQTWGRVTAAALDGRALHNLPVTFHRADGSTADALLDVNGEADGAALRLVARPAFRGSLPGPDGTAETDVRDWLGQCDRTDGAPLVEGLDEAGVTALTKELEDLFELLPVPLHGMARTAEVKRTNQIHLEFLGCPDEPTRFVGQNLLAIFAVEADLVALGASLTGVGAILNFPTTIRRLDGSELPMRVYSSTVTRGDDFVGTRCYLFFDDAADAPGGLAPAST